MFDFRRRVRARAGREPSIPVELTRELVPRGFASDRPVVTNRLFDRLRPEDIAEAERRLEAAGVDGSGDSREDADDGSRRRLLLSVALWLGVAQVSERTGLTAELPPDDVHAMARGPLAAAGALYEADMVVNGLLSAGLDVDRIGRALDFGCSSGRIVRVLAAAYPDVGWQGCDPIVAAIEWARHHLPGIEFFANHDEPPLPIGDGELDLVFGISVWSHFEPAFGLRWFDEMRRVLRPGGQLLMTTHGLTSIDFYQRADERSPAQSLEIERALYSSGAWYAAEFGDQGDWGVAHPAWGTAFLSPEWVLTNLCPRWRVLEFAPGRNADNQDVYVLERV